MVKAQIIKAVAETTAQDIEVTHLIVNEFLKQVQDALVEVDTVYLENFGTFRVFTLKEKTVIDQRNNVEITLPAKKIPEFKAARELRLAVKNSDTAL